MSGELNEEVEPETLYDSGYRPDLRSARDVLSFVLTPTSVFAGQIDPEDMPMVEHIMAQAKHQAYESWRKLNKKR